MKEEHVSLIRNTAVIEMREHPNWREGQTIFNVAFELFPYETNALRGSVYDCFHNDDLIEEFLKNL